MLIECVTNYSSKITPHHRCIHGNGLRYPMFPLGRHGASRDNGRAEIEFGFVRKLSRDLKISPDCFAKHFPA